ncbi:hypothetical protein [Romboutsia timonensis]|uniref:hypothetical protein n=1 Tax=Romboutsia timonensis TaxID=1776391 RepID=UPI003992F255
MVCRVILHQIIYLIGHLNSKNENIYVATGFRKWGNTNGTLAGIIISDLIVSGESKYRHI